MKEPVISWYITGGLLFVLRSVIGTKKTLMATITGIISGML